jgi:hypothetical protein
MKNLIISTLFALCSTLIAAQGCLPEGITFTTQNQIDSFQVNYPGCAEIEGDVNIELKDLTNLIGLQILTSIGGNLNISGDYSGGLDILSGLDSLASIGGDLSITGTRLINMSGLDHVTYIGGNILIHGNNHLISLWGLNGLTSITGSITLYGWNVNGNLEGNSLVSLSGLNNLSSIGGDLNITKNNSLNTLNGLGNLQSVNSLRLGYWDQSGGNIFLASLEGLESLSEITGELFIMNNSNLSSLSGLASLSNISGNLSISNNQELFDLSGLESLVAVGGDLHLSSWTLASLEGLESLVSVGGTVSISNTQSLISLAGLENLTSITGSLYLSYNYGLWNLTGIENLMTIGSLNLDHNNALMNLTGLDGLTTITGALSVYNNDDLLSLTGLGDLTFIGGSLSIEACNSMTTLSGLESLMSIGAELNISECDALSGLSGLENLNTCSLLRISDNDALTSLAGLNSLTSVGDLWINDNDAMTSLAGLDNLDSIGGYLGIFNNQLLSICEAQVLCEYLSNPAGPVDIFGNTEGCRNPAQVAAACGIDPICLPFGSYYFHSQADIDEFTSNYPECTVLNGHVEISGSDITNLDGLGSVYSVKDGLHIINNIALENLSGLESLQNAGYLEIAGNLFLSGLTGLEGLVTIGSLNIGIAGGWGWDCAGNPSLRNLAGLENLVSVGNLTIICNDSLRNLTGIDHLDTDSVGSLTISSNHLLGICDNPFVCGFLENNVADIIDNAPGCNSPEEVMEACAVGMEESAVGGQQSAVSVYPNPTSGIVDFRLSMVDLRWVSLKIYNAQGQEVATVLDGKWSGDQVVRWDAGALPAGLYYYQLRAKGMGQVGAGKIVKY